MQKITILDFWAPWCGPCKTIDPILKEVASQFGDRVEISKINVDDWSSEKMVAEYNIRAIPTLVFLNDDRVEYNRIVGTFDVGSIKQKINESL